MASKKFKVKDVMSSNPQYLPPSATLVDAAKLMRDLDIGFIPIGEPETDRLEGTVTERDMVTNALAFDKGLETPLKDVMSPNLWYCFEDDPINKAAEYMENLQVHRLVVLNSDKRMIGIISLGDIGKKTHNEKLCGEIVEAIAEDRKAA